MSKSRLTVCAFALGLLPVAPCAVQAQNVVLSQPTIACNTPAGVGCRGRNVLQPGTYRLRGRYYSPGGAVSTCRISGPGGRGYVLCSSLGR